MKHRLELEAWDRDGMKKLLEENLEMLSAPAANWTHGLRDEGQEFDWTPIEIEVLLWCHYTGESNNQPERFNSQSGQAAFLLLQSRDLIHGSASTTLRGKAFVEMICSTPLPQRVWMDPRTREMVNECPELS